MFEGKTWQNVKKYNPTNKYQHSLFIKSDLGTWNIFLSKTLKWWIFDKEPKT